MGERAGFVGQTLDGKYRLEKLLGQGGMGAVYLATHLGTDRPVALKVIAPAIEGRVEFVERFRREARAAGRLRHPGVVDVTDFGVCTIGADTLPYLVMEYLDGCTLAEVLREEGRLPIPWVVDILEQACSAVQEAHAHDIVHRDLKPDNLWLEPNRRGGFTVKVLDFGLAKLAEPGGAASVDPSGPALPEQATLNLAPTPPDLDGETLARSTPVAAPASETAAAGPGSAALTRLGDVLGTPLYMSPEQCLGKPLDYRSDVYSLGVIAYRLLAGVPPFSGGSREVMQQHASAPPTPLRERRKDVPASMADLVMASLAKDPSQRPRSAAAFATGLRARSEGAGPLAQRLVMLLGERYPVFLRLSVVGHLPLIAVALALTAAGQWFGDADSVPIPTQLAAHAVLFLSVAISATLASMLSGAVVMQALAEPLRPMAPEALVASVRARGGVYLRTLGPALAIGPYIVLADVVSRRLGVGPLGTLLLNAPVVAAVVWTLVNLRAILFLSSVLHVEGLSGRAALARSSELARRAVRDLPAVGQATLVTALLAGPVWAMLAWANDRLEVLATQPGWPRLGPVTIDGLTGLLATPILIAGVPIFGVAAALLYFRAREAAGESLGEILGRSRTDAAVPAWRSRLKERLDSSS